MTSEATVSASEYNRMKHTCQQYATGREVKVWKLDADCAKCIQKQLRRDQANSYDQRIHFTAGRKPSLSELDGERS